MANGSSTPQQAIVVPSFDELMWPLLEALRGMGGSATNEELLANVIELGAYPADIQAVQHSDGRQTKLNYNLAWAKTYLKKVGALDNSSRGVWSLTKVGEQLTPQDVLAVPNRVRKQDEADRKARKPTGFNASLATAVDASDVEAAEGHWKDQLLRTLRDLTPDAFERLAQRLVREAGFLKVEVTGRSGDGGIDSIGVLRVNLLSFQVLFQCKRYQGNVGAGAIRDFRGAMVGRSDKGLFITTGTFTVLCSSRTSRGRGVGGLAKGVVLTVAVGVGAVAAAVARLSVDVGHPVVRGVQQHAFGGDIAAGRVDVPPRQRMRVVLDPDFVDEAGLVLLVLEGEPVGDRADHAHPDPGVGGMLGQRGPDFVGRDPECDVLDEPGFRKDQVAMRGGRSGTDAARQLQLLGCGVVPFLGFQKSPDVRLDGEGGRQPDVHHGQVERDADAFVRDAERSRDGGPRLDPSALGQGQAPLGHVDARGSGVGASAGLLHRSPGQQERPDQGDGAHATEGRLPPSGGLLSFGGVGRSLCGTRRPLLGHEVVGLTLLGALFALFGTLGLFWVFDDPNRNRKPAGWLLAAVCLPLTLTLYGWARLGFPGSVWGLCG